MSDDFLLKLFQNFEEWNVRPPETYTNERFGVDTPRGSFFGSQNQENDSIMRDFGSIFNFKAVFPDPFEMHKHIEQKFNESFKAFSFESEDFFKQQEPGQFQPPNTPTIEGLNPRDYSLKPGLGEIQMSPNEENTGMCDKRSMSWLDGVWASQSPQEQELQPGVFLSFSSVTRTTVRLPDGTVKSEEIIRKPDGTQERRESQTFPDGSSPNADAPFLKPGSFFSDWFNFPKLALPEPEPRETNPRHQFLKPGYEKLKPFEEKVDKDLNEQIQQEGLNNLPSLPKHPEIEPPKEQYPIKTVIKTTVTLPSGVAETKETVCYSDGTEQSTVTKTSSDGTTATTLDSCLKGTDSPLQSRNVNKEATFILKEIRDLVDYFFK